MKTPPTVLTKSDLQSFLQCPRKLWLEHHELHLLPEDDPVFYRRATDGVIVGEKARELIDGVYVGLSKEEDKTTAAARAKSILHPRADSAEGRRPSTGPEKRSAPRAGQRLAGAVASRWRPLARSLRDRNRL